MVYWLRIARNIRVTPNRFDIKILTMWHSTHQRRIWQGTVPIEAYTTRRPASSRLAKRPRVPRNPGTDLKESPLKDVHFEGFKRDPGIIRHFLMFLLVFQWMDVTHLKPWFLSATRWLVHKLRFYKLGKLTARIHHLCLMSILGRRTNICFQLVGVFPIWLCCKTCCDPLSWCVWKWGCRPEKSMVHVHSFLLFSYWYLAIIWDVAFSCTYQASLTQWSSTCLPGLLSPPSPLALALKHQRWWSWK